MLLALAVAGSVMILTSYFVVTLSQVWHNSGKERFFETHVEGVGVFLNSVFARSEPIDSGQSLPVEWRRPAGYGEFEDPLLAFNLREAPPFLHGSEGAPAEAGIVGYLYRPPQGEGLYLIWRSRLIEAEDENDLNSTLVSPLVKGIVYCYYDFEDDSWEESATPLRGREDGDTWTLPHFIKVRFEHRGESREATVYIPQEGIRLPGAA